MDLPDGTIKPEAASKLKKFVGSDTCEFEAKYEQPLYALNKCKILCSSNFHVNTKSYDEGFERRMLVIPFVYPISIENRDVHLNEKLEAEKPSIVYKALEYYKRLVANNYRFTEINYNYYLSLLGYGNVGTPAIDKQAIINDFLNNCCEADESAKIHNVTLFNAFVNYCNLNNIVLNIDQNEFTFILKKILNPSMFKKMRIDGKNLNGVEGIRLKTC
jgi:putative DNA primase/helicase